MPYRSACGTSRSMPAGQPAHRWTTLETQGARFKKEPAMAPQKITFIFLFSLISIACSSPMFDTSIGTDTRDLSFLRPPPHARQKLAVNLDSVTQKSDLLLIREAVDDIIVFLYNTRAISGQITEHFTREGLINFENVPTIHDEKKGSIKLLPLRQYDFEVTDDQEIKFTCDYGLIGSNPRFEQRMVFKRLGDRWKFDRYEWRRAK